MQGIFTGISWGLELSLEAQDDIEGYTIMHLKWNSPSSTSLHSNSSVSNPIPKLISLHPRNCSVVSLTPTGNSPDEATCCLHWDWGFIANEEGEKI